MLNLFTESELPPFGFLLPIRRFYRFQFFPTSVIRKIKTIRRYFYAPAECVIESAFN